MDQLTDTLSFILSAERLNNLTNTDVFRYYRYFYDNSIGNPQFIEKLHSILVSQLRQNNLAKNAIARLSLILQYPRRHFVDFDLTDPFLHYGVPDIHEDARTVPFKLNLLSDSREE